MAALVLMAALVVGASLARAATNNISTGAGTGTAGFSGDGGPATAAQISTPTAVAATADGGYLIADQGNSRIRRVSPAGDIATVAGNGTAGFGGDSGPATSAQMNAPNGLAETADGGFLFADSNNNRVRRVSPSGVITTVAGTGAATFGGDGGPATSAQLAFPIGVAVMPDGGYLIADNDNHRVRRVAPDGTITTAAGTGGPATSALLNQPIGAGVTTGNDFLIAEASNHRVRVVDAGDPPPPPRPPPPVGPPVLGESVNASVVRGTVLIAVPVAAAARRWPETTAQRGLTFVPLTQERQIPVGSFLNTRRGTVRLESATARADRTQSGQFSAGLFQVLQSRRRAAKGLTELRLKGSSFRRCRRARRGRSADAAQLSRRTIRRVRANARGRFRTRGRHSAATVRGTIWTTTDRCDGTLTKVRRGRVAVRDFRRKRTIVVRAGKSYLARPR